MTPGAQNDALARLKTAELKFATQEEYDKWMATR